MVLTSASAVSAAILLLAGLPSPWGSRVRRQLSTAPGDEPIAGGVSEKVLLTVNGVRQGMFIEGRDVRNPVLLYLHGGMPEYFLTERYPTGLEECFTVVWWEQRGSGLSYSPNIPRETMTLEQMIADTVTVTNWVRQRFGQEQIYLMGHSGGSFIGIQAAARVPQLYRAYVGMAQMCDQLRSEKMAYQYMLRQFETRGDARMVRKLKAAPVTLEGGTPRSYLSLRDRAMHPLGIGTTHDMRSHITGIFLRSLRSRHYTLRDKFHLWRGKASSGVSPLWDEMITTDLSERLTKLQLPVYFFSGVHDYTVNYTLSKQYLDKIEAPLKGFYSFRHSAHSPLFEEPQRARRILQEDVLAGSNRLADAE